MLTPEQIAARKNGIGASESVILFPQIPNPYSTPYQLWMEKTGRIARNQELNDFQWWGHALEPVIAKRYEHETGEVLENRPETVVHTELPYMLCHPDRYVVGKRKLVEIKGVSYDPDKWGVAGTDHVPPEYVIQVQHQLACTGYDEADLIAFFLNYRKSVIYKFKRDNELIDAVEKAVSVFWNNHVLADVAPDLTALSDCKLRFQKDSGTWIEANDEILSLIQKLKVANSNMGVHERRADEIKIELLTIIGEASGIKQDDKILATWKADKNGKRSFRLSEK
jgi:putative phage-type endonuclease